MRQTLYEIREAFEAVGFDKFDADKHVARLDRDALEVDLWDVMESAKRGEPHAILLERDRVTESLLSELETVDPSFRSWLLAKQQSLHNRLVAISRMCCAAEPMRPRAATRSRSPAP